MWAYDIVLGMVSPRHVPNLLTDTVAAWYLFKKRGILHRDISHFNVLCDPKYNVEGVEEDRSRNCIERIL